MNGTKVLVIVLAVVALLFAVTVGLQLKPRNDDPGDTSESRLTGLRDALVGTQALEPGDVEGADCFVAAQSAFVVDAGDGCSVAVPDEVKQVEVCVASGSGAFARIELDGEQFSSQLAEAVLAPCPKPIRFDVYDEKNVLSMACALGGDPCVLRFP